MNIIIDYKKRPSETTKIINHNYNQQVNDLRLKVTKDYKKTLATKNICMYHTNISYKEMFTPKHLKKYATK